MVMRGATCSSTSRRKSLIPVWVSLTASPNREETAARKKRLRRRRARGKASPVFVPTTTAACVASITLSSSSTFSGAISRSASRNATTLPLASAKPRKSAAPLPWFASSRTTRTGSPASAARVASRRSRVLAAVVDDDHLGVGLAQGVADVHEVGVDVVSLVPRRQDHGEPDRPCSGRERRWGRGAHGSMRRCRGGLVRSPIVRVGEVDALVDQVARAGLHLVEHAAQVLADDPEEEQLDAAEKQDQQGEHAMRGGRGVARRLRNERDERGDDRQRGQAAAEHDGGPQRRPAERDDTVAPRSRASSRTSTSSVRRGDGPGGSARRCSGSPPS